MSFLMHLMKRIKYNFGQGRQGIRTAKGLQKPHNPRHWSYSTALRQKAGCQKRAWSNSLISVFALDCYLCETSIHDMGRLGSMAFYSCFCSCAERYETAEPATTDES